MKKIVAIIQARMGSSRLPNKIMFEVLNKPLIAWMVSRARFSSHIDEIVIATTKNKSDDVIEKWANEEGIRIYRGSESDVLDRYYKCAVFCQAEIIIRLTSDCPLIDPEIIDSMLQLYKENNFDYISNSEPYPSSWPDGMDVSIFNMPSLQTAWKKANLPSEREHVTFYFWKNPNLFKCYKFDNKMDMSKYRVTIDYEEDYILIKNIIEAFGENNVLSYSGASMSKIINFLNDNPKIFELNSKYYHGIGWESALNRDKNYLAGEGK